MGGIPGLRGSLRVPLASSVLFNTCRPSARGRLPQRSIRELQQVQNAAAELLTGHRDHPPSLTHTHTYTHTCAPQLDPTNFIGALGGESWWLLPDSGTLCHWKPGCPTHTHLGSSSPSRPRTFLLRQAFPQGPAASIVFLSGLPYFTAENMFCCCFCLLFLV